MSVLVVAGFDSAGVKAATLHYYRRRSIGPGRGFSRWPPNARRCQTLAACPAVIKVWLADSQTLALQPGRTLKQN